MSITLGIDGCKSGWFALWQNPRDVIQCRVFHDLSDLTNFFKNEGPLTIGIDMPVVLDDSIARKADQLARTLLGKKASSIFTAPTLQMLQQTTYEATCQLSKKQFGKSISIQSWHLFPKIRDVQAALHLEQLNLFEIHPELSFRAMNNNEVVLESKKTTEGFLIRKNLLEKHFITFDFEAIRHQHLKKDVSNDDVLDALAVLWSTKRILRKQACFLPEHPLKPNMQIAY